MEVEMVERGFLTLEQNRQFEVQLTMNFLETAQQSLWKSLTEFNYIKNNERRRPHELNRIIKQVLKYTIWKELKNCAKYKCFAELIQ